MPLGRQCVDHYRLLHRYCVFSHDELVCKMACKASSLDVVLASAVQKDMVHMIRMEKELREKVRKMVRGRPCRGLRGLCVSADWFLWEPFCFRMKADVHHVQGPAVLSQNGLCVKAQPHL